MFYSFTLSLLFSEYILDSAHDAYLIYELLYTNNVTAIIDLNSHNTGVFCS